MNAVRDLRALTRTPWSQVIACVLLLPSLAIAFQAGVSSDDRPGPSSMGDDAIHHAS